MSTDIISVSAPLVLLSNGQKAKPFSKQGSAYKSLLKCCQIPPAPPRPDFDASREKLQKLGEGEGSMTKEEFTKMKQELEA